MRRLWLSLMGFLLGFCVFLPGVALADKKGPIVWVADTRGYSGFEHWFAGMYNENILLHAIWVVIFVAIVGSIFGFGMDIVMRFTGLELSKRELKE